DSVGILTLSLAFEDVAAQLPPQARARLSPAQVQDWLDRMATTTNYGELWKLSNAFRTMAEHLGQDQAAAAAQRLLDLVTSATDPSVQEIHSDTLRAVVHRLGPADAAVLGRRLAEEMARTTDPALLDHLGLTCLAVTAKLD